MLNVVDNPVIRIDKLGDGHYLAPRGERLHRGVDYVVVPGANVYAPVNGHIVRESWPYKDGSYSGVLFQGSSIAFKIWYFSPYLHLIGEKLKAGTILGKAQDISKRYGKDMIPHIHIEVADMDLSLFMGKL